MIEVKALRLAGALAGCVLVLTACPGKSPVVPETAPSSAGDDGTPVAADGDQDGESPSANVTTSVSTAKLKRARTSQTNEITAPRTSGHPLTRSALRNAPTSPWMSSMFTPITRGRRRLRACFGGAVRGPRVSAMTA